MIIRVKPNCRNNIVSNIARFAQANNIDFASYGAPTIVEVHPDFIEIYLRTDNKAHERNISRWVSMRPECLEVRDIGR